MINGPPIGEVVRLQSYSDEAAKDRAFCVAAWSISTTHDLLWCFSRSRCEASFYQGRVRHYQEVVAEKDQKMESLSVQVEKMNQANFSLKLHVRQAQQKLSDEIRGREKEKSELEACITDMEKDKVFATSQAKAKVVVVEQKLAEVQELLARERADRATEVKRLTDELSASVAARSELGCKLKNVEAGRRWLISQGFSFVYEKLRNSAEFLKPIGTAQQAINQRRRVC
jgi:predicted RNase H-like nuclease (RuvC/YqgF family)